MNSFEIYLLNPAHAPASAEQVRAGLRAVPWTRRHNDGPRPSFSYLNADTGVYFAIAAPALDGAEVELGETGALDDDAGESDGEPAGGASGGGAPDPDGTEGDAEPPIELAAMTLSVPLSCPRFFGAEAAGAAVLMAQAAGLEATAGDGLSSAGEIARAWEAANEAAAGAPGCQGAAVWDPEESAAWYRYGAGRAALQAELGPAGVAVPRLQAARHAGRVRSLVAWDEWAPSVLPRTGLVLIRRERRRRGLLFLRQVHEEGIAEGDALWNILAGACEIRDQPAPLLVYRGGAPPQDVAARLEVLPLDPVETARRTHLVGVVDFTPAGCKESRP